VSDFPARKAPDGATSTTWNDAGGTHEVQIKPDGVFKPKSASEEAHAVNLGWPLIDGPLPASKPPKAAKPKRASKPRSVPEPAAPAEPAAVEATKETD
jgi:hypothetical protein